MFGLDSIFIVLITFGLLVSIHEFGHYWVARRCGVKVLRFAIGFGPVLFSWKDKNQTEFAWCALPLGGYVKMLDEREGDVPAELAGQAFNNKHPKKRIAIALAGPAANFILAIAVYWLVFVSGTTGIAPVLGDLDENSPAAVAGLIAGDELVAVDGNKVESWQAVNRSLMLRLGDTGGVEISALRSGANITASIPISRWLAEQDNPDLMGGVGFVAYQPVVEPVLDDVLPDSAADKAGLLVGDRLLAVNGIAITDWYSWVDTVQRSANELLLVNIERGGELLVLPLTPAEYDQNGTIIGRVGVMPVPPTYPQAYIREFKYPPHIAVIKAVEQTLTLSKFTLESMGKLIQGLISPKNLSGPITIAKVAADSTQHGFEYFLNILALLSISLGVLNLLPIPVLDGGHIVYHSIEWLKGSPVSEKVQEVGLRIGVSMVLCLMLFALFNDISRLIGI